MRKVFYTTKRRCSINSKRSIACSHQIIKDKVVYVVCNIQSNFAWANNESKKKKKKKKLIYLHTKNRVSSGNEKSTRHPHCTNGLSIFSEGMKELKIKY
jgi:pyrimidine deaminase RibD-like protein